MNLDVSVIVLCIIIAMAGGLVGAWLSKTGNKPLREIREHIDRIAGGNLQQRLDGGIFSKEAGRLADALDKMQGNLQRLIAEVGDAANRVSLAVQQLATAVRNAAKGASQVAAANNLVADQADEQVKTTDLAKTAVEAISAKLDQVSGDLQTVAGMTSKTSEAVKTGVIAIGQAITQMENIKTTVASSAQTMVQLGERSKEIGQIVDTISAIAGQTNLLSLNAAIEAARAVTAVRGEINIEMDKHMVAAAKLVTIVLKLHPSPDVAAIKELASETGLEEIWVTDGDGVISLANNESGIGFKFPDTGQAAEFRAILANPGLVVTQPPAMRDLDGLMFKYVGVGRKDQRGIVQVGVAFRQRDVEKVSAGFAVVADEVRNLAAETQKASRHITAMINEIQKDTARAVGAMNDGTRQVNMGGQMVVAAGQSFDEINKLVSTVSQDTHNIATSMEETVNRCRQAVDAVLSLEKTSLNITAQVGNVSAAAQQQMAFAQEIATASQLLGTWTEKLQSTTATFSR